MLLTGARGYIGAACSVVSKKRSSGAVSREGSAGHRTAARHGLVTGDCLDERPSMGARRREPAYYLVHSMNAGSQYADLTAAAGNFGRAAGRAGVQRIIYLGAGRRHQSLSTHREAAPKPARRCAPGAFGRRVPGVDRHRRRQPVVRDDQGARRAVAGHGVPALGGHATQPIAIDDVIAYLVRRSTSRRARADFRDRSPEVSRTAHHARVRAPARLATPLLPVPILSAAPVGSWLALVTRPRRRSGVRSSRDSRTSRSCVRRRPARSSPSTRYPWTGVPPRQAVGAS